MRSRVSDVPALKTIPSYIEATYYNRVRLALMRLGNPLRIELMNMRGLDIIITDHEWVCVDRTIGDMPTLAWTGFESAARAGLHRPVACQLRFFHNHADLICGTVLDLVHRHIEKRLAANLPAHQHRKVIYLSAQQQF
jgi:hypothetical protein